MKPMLQKGVICLTAILIGLALVQPFWMNVAYLDLFAYLRNQDAAFTCDPVKAPVYQPLVPAATPLEAQWVSFRADLARGIVNHAALEELLRDDPAQTQFLAPLLIEKTFAACLAVSQPLVAEAMVRDGEKAGLMNAPLEEKLAQLFESKKRPAEALEVYTQLISFDPQQAPHYLFKMGQLFQEIQAFDKAQSAYLQALEKSQLYNWSIPQDEYLTLLYLGDVYFQQTLYDRALSTYQQITNKCQSWQCASAWQRIGTIQLVQAKNTEAIESFKKSIDFTPDSPWVYIAMGNVYDQLGDTTSALGQYERAYAIDHQSIDLNSYKKKLGIRP